jgi:hypothetical protein
MEPWLVRVPFVVGGVALVCGVVVALWGFGPFSSGCWDIDDDIPQGSSSSSLSLFPPGERCEIQARDGHVVSKVTSHWRDVLLAVCLAGVAGFLFWPVRDPSRRGVLTAAGGMGACLVLALAVFF